MHDERRDLDMFDVNMTRRLELANHVWILCEIDKPVENIKYVEDEGVSQIRTHTLHRRGKFSKLGRREYVCQTNELTEDIRIRRLVGPHELHPETAKNHDVCKKGDDIIQRILSSLDEHSLRHRRSLFRGLVEHLLQAYIFRRVLQKQELVVI